jgi:hypothetical protein
MYKGRQVKELKEIQKEKETIQKELDKIGLFPKWYKYGSKSYMIKGTPDELCNTLTLILFGAAPFEILNQYCIDNFTLEDAQNFFKDVGNYFLNLSGNLETRKPLEERLAVLNMMERDLKEKLGIK